MCQTFQSTANPRDLENCKHAIIFRLLITVFTLNCVSQESKSGHLSTVMTLSLG